MYQSKCPALGIEVKIIQKALLTYFSRKAVVYFFVSLVAYSQEGWRLEHEMPTDKTSQIIFKGVVYNEMKGAFVSFDSFICLSRISSGCGSLHLVRKAAVVCSKW